MIRHDYSDKEIGNIAKWRGKLENKRIRLTCNYKKGEEGTVFFETVDEESNRPYMYVKLDIAPKVGGLHEVFWYNEVELIEED